MSPSFLLALQFLTRLPVRVTWPADPAARAAAVPFYPLVGLVIGLLLVVAHVLFGAAAPGLQAAILLALWVGITGALHLDGLADTVDGWVGGHGDRERTLAIMKDSNTGAMGAVAVALVLILKFAALQTLLEAGEWGALLLTPVLGRAALVAALLSLPYVRPGGIGADLARHLPREVAQLAVAASLGACLLLGFGGIVVGLVLAAAGYGAWRVLRRHLGGTTGDTAGALCELAEALALVTGALVL